jgi:hypothetical protein
MHTDCTDAVRELKRAESLLTRERRRTRAERRAFEEFGTRVEAIAASGGTGDRAPSAPLVRSPTDAAHREVTEAYRETVMAVPHYDDEFGEPLAANMRAELGVDVATALLDGGQFSAPVKEWVLETASEMVAQRDRYLAVTDAEAASLSDSRARLASLHEAVRDCRSPPAEDQFADLRATWNRLTELRADCDQLLRERQAWLQNRASSGTSKSNRWEVLAYLYGPLSASFPVLDAGVAVVACIDRQRRERERAMADWD